MPVRKILKATVLSWRGLSHAPVKPWMLTPPTPVQKLVIYFSFFLSPFVFCYLKVFVFLTFTFPCHSEFISESFLFYSRSLQQILKQVQDDGRRVFVEALIVWLHQPLPLMSFRIYFGIFFFYSRSSNGSWNKFRMTICGPWAGGHSVQLYGRMPSTHTTNTPSHLPARTRNSGLPADDLHTWSGGEATTQNSPIFFPWEIKMKNSFHQLPPNQKHQSYVCIKQTWRAFLLNISLGFIWSGEFRNQIPWNDPIVFKIQKKNVFLFYNYGSPTAKLRCVILQMTIRYILFQTYRTI